MKLFRWLRAKFGGYFWLPCPWCGRMFGGFEWGESLMDINDCGRGRVTCNDPKCMEQVQLENLRRHPQCFQVMAEAQAMPRK
jgi:hypothetical protein